MKSFYFGDKTGIYFHIIQVLKSPVFLEVCLRTTGVSDLKSHSQHLLVFRTHTHPPPFSSLPGPASSVSCPSLDSSNPSLSLLPDNCPQPAARVLPSSQAPGHSPSRRSLLIASQDSPALLLPSEQVNRTSGITTECLPVKGILLFSTWHNPSP